MQFIDIPPPPYYVPDPEIPEVLNLSDGSYQTLAEVVGDVYGDAVKKRLEIKDALASGVPLYACAECGVPIFQEQVMSIAMVAAGFSAGKADALRRAMAAWQRKGNLAQFEDDLLSGMLGRGYDEAFANNIIGQLKGFAAYGFPESHAHSFALIAYASCWLKRHEPAAFLAALLNSQPMGFYSPSSLVQDAQRNGIEVRPPDVRISNWEATLEPPTKGMQPAVRLGLNIINGMEQEAAWRIEEARAIAPFKSTTDLASRANLDEGDMNKLAQGDALQTLSGNRRQAIWQAKSSVPDKGLLRPAEIKEELVELDAPTEAEDVVTDYKRLGLTLRSHPLSFLRGTLTARKFVTSDVLAGFADRQLARACGIVTVRQRPGTAKGVVFLTLEDEHGTVNVICWPSLVDEYRKEVMGAELLGVYGIWQSESGVRHLVAKRMVDLSPLLGEIRTKSRDFQ
ncbi:hypothetical protein GTP44_15470 [Duganella sp. FT50W]|uniref:Error-prone DNA polymerase n=1 Tax=Duganella lactea TaxID=2692173 RepID=A0A6L8MQU8_9BURK|nr:hypothetical protein [Duganella lactea]